VSPSSPVVVLASGRLNRSGDQLSVELHQPVGHPPALLLRWPVQPTICQPTPRALAAMASQIVQVLAESQAALAHLRTGREL
jgi:hypothetical protein